MRKPPASPTDDRLRALLQDALRERSATITALTRRPSHYRSSYPLEEISAILDNGERLELMLKLTNRSLLTAEALAAKPEPVADPAREIEVYRSMLAATPLGTARCYAAVADDQAQEHWLCIETVGGVELYQVGELELWERVAEWLAGFHARFATDTAWRSLPAARHLLAIDALLMQQWLDRARLFALERGNAPATAALTALDECWDDVVGTLASWPRTLVHGECYASNVLVDAGQAPARVCPVDWEMAGDGAGIIDLAALTAGGWQHGEADRIASAYVRAAARNGFDWPRPQFDRALTCARAFIAVQWLGWSRHWTPPAEHSVDWAAALSRNVKDLAASG